MLIDAIWDWNPWWDDAGRIKALLGLPREETPRLIGSLDDKKVTIIAGVRRAGKTTLMYQMIGSLLDRGVAPKNILFLGLEDPAFAGESLDTLLAEYRKEHSPEGSSYLFLDEIQSREGWERSVRKQIDMRSDLKIVVSGSSSALSGGEYATLLTGRNITYMIRPLSFRGFYIFIEKTIPASFRGAEIEEKAGALLRRYLDTGGFPEVVLQPEERRKTTLNQYFSDIIHRDIINRYRVEAKKIHAMAGFLLKNPGSIMSLSSLRRATGLSYDAIRDYLRHLESAGIFSAVREFTFSTKPAMNEAGKFKIYCTDLGMARVVQGRHSRDYGRFAENAVFLELKECGMSVGFFKGKKEVDFVALDALQNVHLINVCMAEKLPEREFEGIREFAGTYSRAKVKPLILTSSIEGEDGNIKLVPLWKWLLEPSPRRLES